MERPWPSPTIITPRNRESSRGRRDSKRNSNADLRARVLRWRISLRQRRNRFGRPCLRVIEPVQPPRQHQKARTFNRSRAGVPVLVVAGIRVLEVVLHRE